MFNGGSHSDVNHPWWKCALKNPIVLYMENSTERIPSVIFIVPYRDREQHYKFFDRHMRTVVLEDYEKEDYKILYIHQCDKREFNRGALKNIGFLTVKDLYPEHYKSIVLVFNDVDTMPFTKGFIDYKTTAGTVKHFYGFDYALGGFFSILAGDFEKTGGFPNFWAWGYEDNMMQFRVNKAGLTIDRSQFYKILDKNILFFYSGFNRQISEAEFTRYTKLTTEGFHTIRDLQYEIDHDTGFVNITAFNTGVEPSKTIEYDMKEKFPFKQYVRNRFQMTFL